MTPKTTRTNMRLQMQVGSFIPMSIYFIAEPYNKIFLDYVHLVSSIYHLMRSQRNLGRPPKGAFGLKHERMTDRFAISMLTLTTWIRAYSGTSFASLTMTKSSSSRAISRCATIAAPSASPSFQSVWLKELDSFSAYWWIATSRSRKVKRSDNAHVKPEIQVFGIIAVWGGILNQWLT